MIGQLARFCTVGVSNTLVTLTVFALLGAGGAPDALAAALAFGAGAANGYVLNRRWTFAVAHDRGRLMRYIAVQALGAGLSALAIAAVRHGFAVGRLPAEALTLPLVTLLTFSLARTAVFGPARA